MALEKERVLLVEDDPEISDLISRQALRPMGFQVYVVEDASTAISKAVSISPDVIIVNLNLPGLSGKDLLVALSSQGVGAPVIVIAEEDMDQDVIQAFRLGASDYIQWPLREAEVVSAVERAIRHVRASKEREHHSKRLEKTNRNLKQRVKELTTIYAMGKAVTSITDQRLLFLKIMEGAVYVSEADRGWLLLRKDDSKTYILRAYKNMPKSISSKINKPWDDGISSLVAISGETLSLHGKPVSRFKMAHLGQAVMVAPIRVQEEVIGLLVVVRKQAVPFTDSQRTLLEAVADYASISLVNARLFNMLERRALSLQDAVENAQEGERVKSEIMRRVNQEMRAPLISAVGSIDMLLHGKPDTLPDDIHETIEQVEENLNQLTRIAEAMNSLEQANQLSGLASTNLCDLVRQSVNRHKDQAEDLKVDLDFKYEKDPILGFVDSQKIVQVIDTFISNALKFSQRHQSVEIFIGRHPNRLPMVMVKDHGQGIPHAEHERIFDPFYQTNGEPYRKFSGLGIGLAMAKEIITAHGGELWFDSSPGTGSTFTFTVQNPG